MYFSDWKNISVGFVSVFQTLIKETCQKWHFKTKYKNLIFFLKVERLEIASRSLIGPHTQYSCKFHKNRKFLRNVGITQVCIIALTLIWVLNNRKKNVIIAAACRWLEKYLLIYLFTNRRQFFRISVFVHV